MKSRLTALGVTGMLAIAAAHAAESKDTRAGSCEDAKKQMEFFCDPNSTDMMSQFTACTNAKKNVAAACEGKTEEDKAYKFEQ
jgi:Spy/CpxP family protein refolding chaperone